MLICTQFFGPWIKIESFPDGHSALMLVWRQTASCRRNPMGWEKVHEHEAH